MIPKASSGEATVKNPPAMQETQEKQAQSLCWEDPLEEERATHSSSLAWEISWTEEPVGYSPWGRKRVENDLVTKQKQV